MFLYNGGKKSAFNLQINPMIVFYILRKQVRRNLKFLINSNTYIIQSLNKSYKFVIKIKGLLCLSECQNVKYKILKCQYCFATTARPRKQWPSNEARRYCVSYFSQCRGVPLTRISCQSL